MQTGQEAEAQTQLGDSNRTKAQTGDNDQHEEQNRVGLASPPDQDSQGGGSHCEPFRKIIGEKVLAGLSAKRIHQDLVAEHGFAGKYWSVYRFVSSLQSSGALPFRRIEVAPGEELQVDFGTGAKIREPSGTFRRTHASATPRARERLYSATCRHDPFEGNAGT